MSPYGPGLSEAGAQECRHGEGRDHEGQLLGLQGPAEGQQGQRRGAGRNGLPETAIELESCNYLVEGSTARSPETPAHEQRDRDSAAGDAAGSRPVVPLRRAREAMLAPLVALLRPRAVLVFLLFLGASPADFLDLVWRGAFGSWFSSRTPCNAPPRCC